MKEKRLGELKVGELNLEELKSIWEIKFDLMSNSNWDSTEQEKNERPKLTKHLV